MNQALLRAAAALAWHLRIVPSSPGWLDMAFAVPLMDTTRARVELGWHPQQSADEVVLEVLRVISENAGLPVRLPPAGRTCGPGLDHHEACPQSP